MTSLHTKSFVIDIANSSSLYTKSSKSISFYYLIHGLFLCIEAKDLLNLNL